MDLLKKLFLMSIDSKDSMLAMVKKNGLFKEQKETCQ